MKSSNLFARPSIVVLVSVASLVLNVVSFPASQWLSADQTRGRSLRLPGDELNQINDVSIFSGYSNIRRQGRQNNGAAIFPRVQKALGGNSVRRGGNRRTAKFLAAPVFVMSDKVREETDRLKKQIEMINQRTVVRLEQKDPQSAWEITEEPAMDKIEAGSDDAVVDAVQMQIDALIDTIELDKASMQKQMESIKGGVEELGMFITSERTLVELPEEEQSVNSESFVVFPMKMDEMMISEEVDESDKTLLDEMKDIIFGIKKLDKSKSKHGQDESDASNKKEVTSSPEAEVEAEDISSPIAESEASPEAEPEKDDDPAVHAEKDASPEAEGGNSSKEDDSAVDKEYSPEVTAEDSEDNADHRKPAGSAKDARSDNDLDEFTFDDDLALKILSKLADLRSL